MSVILDAITSPKTIVTASIVVMGFWISGLYDDIKDLEVEIAELKLDLKDAKDDTIAVNAILEGERKADKAVKIGREAIDAELSDAVDAINKERFEKEMCLAELETYPPTNYETVIGFSDQPAFAALTTTTEYDFDENMSPVIDEEDDGNSPEFIRDLLCTHGYAVPEVCTPN